MLGARAFDHARVAGEQLIHGGGGEDGMEKPVGLGRRRYSHALNIDHPGVPPSDDRRCEPAKLKFAKGGNDV